MFTKFLDFLRHLSIRISLMLKFCMDLSRKSKSDQSGKEESND